MGLLTKLPAELVEAIVTTLCVHCTQRDEERCCYTAECACANAVPADVERISALASLCLTSRRLNIAATRHLYHTLDNRRRFLLARTLLARPDLAQLARTLRIGFHDGSGKADCPPEVEAYFFSQRTAYLDSLSEEARPSAKNNLHDDSFYGGHNNLSLDILISLCANLETLDSTISYFEVFRFCAPNSLPHLKTTTLIHADTEYAIHGSNIFPLFRAAPNLARALFVSVDSFGKLDMALPRLTHLEFHNTTIDRRSLTNILQACPNVETFHYTMGAGLVGYEQFSIAEARTAFLEFAPKLKTLSLGAGDNDHCDEEWDEDEAVELGKVMKERGVRFEFKSYDWDQEGAFCTMLS